MSAALNVKETYKYDVFISYPHEPDHHTWVHKYFLPKFRLYLRQDLGYDPQIYVDDDRLAPGATWPVNLKKALSRTRVLIPVWSIDYFISNWCKAECSVMLYREKALKMRTGEGDDDGGLILPVRLFDGKGYPEFAQKIHSLDCNDFNNIAGNFEQTPNYFELVNVIKKWTPKVADRIRRSPEWSAEWTTEAWLDEPIRQCGVSPDFEFPDRPFELEGIG